STSAADLFAAKLGLERAETRGSRGVAAAAVAAGGVVLRFVAGETSDAGPEAAALRAEVEADGEGLAGLALEVPAVAAAATPLAPFGGAREGDRLRLDPAKCHGVRLAFR